MPLCDARNAATYNLPARSHKLCNNVTLIPMNIAALDPEKLHIVQFHSCLIQGLFISSHVGLFAEASEARHTVCIMERILLLYYCAIG